MKKFNILITLVISLLLIQHITAQSSNQQSTSLLIKNPTRFYNISPNGKFAIGNIGSNKGIVYSVEHDILLDLPLPEAQANCITNEGIIYGDYMKKPAYFEIDWEEGDVIPIFLPEPELPENIKDVDRTSIYSVSADGSLACGMIYNLKLQCWPLIWDLKAGTVSFAEMPADSEDVTVWSAMTKFISADGNLIVGRVILDKEECISMKYTTGIWDRDGQFKGYISKNAMVMDPEIIEDDDVLNISSNGNYIVGRATISEKDSDLLEYYPFYYDVKKDEFKVVKDINGYLAGFMSVADNGLMFGSKDGGGIPANGTAIVYQDSKEYTLSDWLKEFYQFDLNLSISGLPLACTADGKTIAGTGYVTTETGSAICGYIINLGDKKVCPKIENLTADVLGNETVYLNWDASKEQYESKILGFNIYRNDELINNSPFSNLEFSESLTEVGTYYYCVETIYEDGCSSGKSDHVGITIYAKGNCYPTNELSGFATNDDEKSIKLIWEFPDFDIRYDSGIAKLAITNEGLPIYFAQKWTKEDIRNNGWNGFLLTGVSFFVNAKADFELKIYTSKTAHSDGIDKNMELVYSQFLTAKHEFNEGGQYYEFYDNFITFNLNEPISLNDEYNIYIAIGASNYDQNTFPAPYDDQMTKKLWKSDLIAIGTENPDEKLNFISFTAYKPNFQGNWLLYSTVTPIREQITATDGVVSLFDKTVESYTVFRNGEELATVYTNEFTDNKLPDNITDDNYIYNVIANYKYACSSDFSNEVRLKRTDVNENPTEKISIYPNPVTDGFCQINGDYSELQISDFQGRVVYQTKANDNIINLTNLKSGIYLVKIFLNEQFIVKKLVIK